MPDGGGLPKMGTATGLKSDVQWTEKWRTLSWKAPHLLSWINYNPSMDKLLHLLSNVGCSSLSIPKFNGSAVEVWEWVINSSHTSLGMWFLIMLGLKLIHVSKRGPSSIDVWQRNPWKIFSRYRFSFRDHGRPWSVILLRGTICLLIMPFSPLNKNYCGQYDYLIYHYIYRQ